MCDKSRWILKTILKKSYFIEVQLIYNVVLISAIQQSDSVIHIYIYTFFFILFSIMVYELYSSLCYTVGSCSSILYIIVCIHLSQTPSPPLSHLPSIRSATTSLFSMSETQRWTKETRHHRAYTDDYIHIWGFPGSTSGKEPEGQCRRHKRLRFDPWVGKIPSRRKWQPTPVLWPGESRGQRSLAGKQSIGLQKSQTWLKWCSTYTHIFI